MTRPEEINARLANVRDIGDIVAALRAIALAHQVEAREHLDAIRRHEASVASALSSTLAMQRFEGRRETGEGPAIAIIIGAAQGFSGSYADQMAAAAREAATEAGVLFLVGGRTHSALQEAGLRAHWFAEMAPHALQVPELANRMADALFRQLAAAAARSVTLLFMDPAGDGASPERRSLLPFDYSRFPPSASVAPLTTLPVPQLLSTLVDEYIFAELCEALMLGFAAESAARANAMARAHNNVEKMVRDLKEEGQRARQEQMTTEIIGLATASEAVRSR